MNPPSILVVEDEKLARWVVREKLATLPGVTVAEAASVAEVMAQCRRQQFSVILLDIGLPDGSGMDALASLREAGCKATIIMLTAHDEAELILRALRLGAADYLQKPFDLDTLLNLVARHLPAPAAAPAPPMPAPLARFIGCSPAIHDLRDKARLLCQNGAQTLLIQGPSGGGKTFLARAFHAAGPRASNAFMEINCAALPAHLLESELFGHERGAFTDARQTKRGLLELADGGTVLLDEIGDMDLALQAKLLSVIETRRFKRVGGVTDISVDCAIIATTNVDLEAAVANKRFRLDLYYRLRVVPLTVPPLASRPEDIAPLVARFLQQLNHDLHRQVQGISPGALAILARHAWPGNVRELRNMLEHILLLHDSPTIMVEHLPPEMVAAALHEAPAAEAPNGGAGLTEPLSMLMRLGASLDDIEREAIRHALSAAHGNLSVAGRQLGLHRDTLRYRARKHGIPTEPASA